MQSFNREDYIHRLEADNERLKQIILGNEMEITAKDETIDQLQKAIKDLEWQIKQILEDNESYQKENEELEKRNGKLAGQMASLACRVGGAKAIIKNIIRVTRGEGWNYSLQLKVEAEQFLKEGE